MLPAMPHGGLGLPGQLQHDDGRCQLGGSCERDMLRSAACLVGGFARRQDESPLPQCLFHVWSAVDECRSSAPSAGEDPGRG